MTTAPTTTAPTAPSGLSDERLSELYGRPGPFLTVYLEGDEVGAEPTSSLRWKNLRRDAEAAGADESVLDRVDAVVDGERWEDTLVVVADSEGVLLDGVIDRSPGDLAVWHRLPRLAPVLAWRAEQVPYVVVLADRVGADLAVVDGASLAESVTVEGSALHITRSAPGGWSQRRYQQRAENRWERNAAEVADELTARADDVDAAFIAVAGDVRAVQFLEEHLDERHTELLYQVRGGRHASDDLDGTAEDLARLQATAAAERVVATLERFAAARANDGAVEGAEGAVDALQRGMVAELLVVDDLGADRDPELCWITDDPMLVATDADTLRSLDRTAWQAPLVDAAVRAALAQGGEVVVVPAHGPASPTGGVGAVLRG